MIRSTLLAGLLFLAPCLSQDAIAGTCINALLTCDGHTPGAGLSIPDAVAELDCNGLHKRIHVAFDHIAGVAEVDAQSVAGNWPSASVYDEFVLTGPPAGTVVAITVVGDFELVNIRQENHVTVVGGGIWTPPIAGAPDPSYAETDFTASAPGTESVTRQLRLTMNMKAGQPYEIQLSANVFTSGNAGGSSHGRLSFEGLPAGASITSCKGFRQDAPTPTLAKSWGAIKHIYR